MLGRKRAGKEQHQESLKKQRIVKDKESYEVEEDDKGELKKHLMIKKDEDMEIDAIPLATKLPVIIDYKLHNEGIMVHYQLIRANGSSKRYSSMIRMLQGIDREDLEALWRIVKEKYSDIRPEDKFERVLWGYFKVMFKPDKRSDVWRILQGYKVTIWKLIDSSGVYFIRRNLKIQKMNIKFRGGLLGLKRLHGFLEVTTAQRLVISLFVQDYCFIDFTSRVLRFGINKWYQSFALRNFDLEDMELKSTNSGPTAKLPILKLVPQTTQENDTTVTKMSIPATAEEKTNKKNDVKARSLLLMALPNEHQLTFSQYPDAKSMFAAIETRFGESLDSIFNRLQKIVSRLAILGVIIAQEDLNLKILSSLPPEWNTHVVVWMNKHEVDTMSIDDLYNNFKIVEQKVEDLNGSNLLHQDLEQIREDDLEAMDLKWQLSLLSMRAKRYYQKTGKKIFITAGFDKSKVECFNCHKIRHFARECRTPKSKEGQFRNHDNIRKQENNKNTSSKAMLAIDGVGFDWSDMAKEQVQTNMTLMAFSDSEVYNDKTCSKTVRKTETLEENMKYDFIVKLNQTEFTSTIYKRGLSTLEEQLITYRNNEVLFSEEVSVLKTEVACKDYVINVLKSDFEKVKQEKEGIEFKIEKFDKASKDLDQLLGCNTPILII
ncbi:ribonuclease H-like domain-containing protein [Tanacetum coccineum]